MKKKIIKIMLTGVVALFLIGCSNSATKKYENALASLDLKDYQTSISLLKEVLEKDPDNSEAKEIISIISDYQQALELAKEDKLEDAKKILDNLTEVYSNYAIKEDIQILIDDVNKRINDKEVAIIDDMLKKARDLFDDGKYTECKEFLDSNVTPKINSSNFLSEDFNAVVASLYSQCDDSIIAIEEKAKEEQVLQTQNISNNYNNSNSTGQQNNEVVVSPVVPDESTNPYSDGMKNINGFTYSVKDGSHWNAKLQYNLACAGMYNKIIFTTPAGELASILYYSDDASFEYEPTFGQSYTGSYFGTYNGRDVFHIIEFNY